MHEGFAMTTRYGQGCGRAAGWLGGGLAALMATTTAGMAESPKVKVLDRTFDTGGAMFAYTEYELAGEPLAEGLGLNLDVLDPDRANQPTAFDFTAGITAYEFSEEAMYALNYQSQLGPHMVNGPLNARDGGTMADLGKRFLTLATSVGFPADELPLNLYPVALPLAHGDPQFRGPVDVKAVNTDTFDITTQDGTEKTVEATTPAYYRDYASLAWQPEPKGAITPVAAGGALLKDVMWAQDFMGGMHDATSDEEVAVTGPDMDSDGKVKLGLTSADGLNGVILTQMAWDQMLTLRDNFLTDGKTLGVKLDPAYDGSAPVWIPARTDVTMTPKNGMNALAAMNVSDGGSSLRGTWAMLWPLAEFYGYSDQRDANTGQNPAFRAVFDGAPFAAAPAANRATDRAGYVAADDPFSLAEQLSNMAFVNLSKLHFDPDAGTLVDRWTPEGGRGKLATTFDGAYAIVAAGIYARAVEALPVGYASGDAGKPLGTPEGKAALALIRAQADFIVDKLVAKNGLVADSYVVGEGPSSAQSLGTQFAAIRGLAAAFTATGDEKYRDAARAIYTAVEAHMVDTSAGIYSPTPGKAFTVTPWTQGAVMGGLHVLMQVLANREGETAPALSLQNLTTRYTAWFKVAGTGLQLAEWIGDSGEHYIPGDTNGDVNGNGVKGLTHAGGPHGTAMVMAAKIEVTPGE